MTLGGIDQPSTTYLAFGKYFKRSGNTIRTYVSLKKAYDYIKRESLYDILIKFGVPKKFVRLIKTCLLRTQSKLRIGNYLSSSFPIENGFFYQVPTTFRSFSHDAVEVSHHYRMHLTSSFLVQYLTDFFVPIFFYFAVVAMICC